MTKVADLVVETTETMGVGTITLLGAVPGCFSFTESFDDGDEVFYCQRQQGGSREVCKGVFNVGPPATLTRGTVLRSNISGDAPVDWGDGVRMVYCVLPASQVLLSENALSEIADFLIADNSLSEIAALGTGAQDDALANLGGTVLGIALVKAVNAAAARTSLGLGSAALLTAGTAAGNAVALDGGAALPAVLGHNLLDLPAHTHAGIVGPYTGGGSSKVVRYTSSGVVVAASKGDTPDLLAHLMVRGSDGVLYGRGSVRVPFAGVTAGALYYLSTSGDLTTSAPTPISSPFTSQVRIGVGMEAGYLYFDPQPPVGGVTGFGGEVALFLDGGSLRVR